MRELTSFKEINQAIEAFGLMPAIGKIFGVGTNIRLPFSEQDYNTEIEELNLSVRSYNCLKRAGKNTVGEVIEIIQKNELINIRNLGKLSRGEIRAKVCEFGYNKLSRGQKEDFINGLINNFNN